MINYYIFGSTDDYCELLLSDLYSLKNVEIYNDRKSIGGFLKRAIHALIIKYFANVPLLFDWYIKKYLLLITGKKHFSSENNNVFIVFDSRYFAFRKSVIRFLKKYGKVVLLFYNPINKTPYNEKKHRKMYDLICILDKDSAKKYDVAFVPNFYSKLDVEEDEETSDIFFVGSAKGRLEFLVDFYEKATKSGLKCVFYITNVEENEKKYSDKIHYNVRLPYIDVIRKVKASKCVLEVVQSNVIGGTLRTEEAICYDKYLITTNAGIVYNTSYDDRFMKIIDNLDDFSFDSMDLSKSVLYHKLDKSPINTLRAISTHLKI